MNLGTKLIVSLVTVIILTMMVHGYLSIEQGCATRLPTSLTSRKRTDLSTPPRPGETSTE